MAMARTGFVGDVFLGCFLLCTLFRPGLGQAKAPDVDECKTGADKCSANALCENTIGSYTCTCLAGFTGNGTNCTDVNECNTRAKKCSANALCRNTIGSYTCTCLAGFTGNGTNCTDVNECNTRAKKCSANALCRNTIGSFTCTCLAGFTGEGTTCTDINECSGTNNCHNNAVCTNTVGSFRCSCNAGWSGDGVSCRDINECIIGTHNCDVNAACVNRVGSYTCVCNTGYSGDGTRCSDENNLPVVTRIFPLDTIRSGGTILTVKGQYLNSTKQAVLYLTIKGKHETGRMRRQAPQAVTLSNVCDRETIEFDEMKCRTPNTTEEIVEGQEKEYDLYIGLTFDGILTYRNLSGTPFGQLNLHPDPIFYPWTEEKWAESETHLLVEGRSMEKGCGVDDYTVSMGESECKIIELLDNQLLCLPANTTPAQTPRDLHLGNDGYYFLVQVGSGSIHEIGILRYGMERNLPLNVIIGASAAAVFIILVTIVICISMRKRMTT